MKIKCHHLRLSPIKLLKKISILIIRKNPKHGIHGNSRTKGRLGLSILWLVPVCGHRWHGHDVVRFAVVILLIFFVLAWKTHKCFLFAFAGKSFKSKRSVTGHERRCLTQKGTAYFLPTSELTCKTCNLTFKTYARQIKHAKKHEAPGGFVCGQCRQRFTTQKDLIDHKESVHKPFLCQLCFEPFFDVILYENHIKTEHDGKDRTFEVCADCGAEFKTITLLK